jgi:hypothetical protein
MDTMLLYIVVIVEISRLRIVTGDIVVSAKATDASKTMEYSSFLTKVWQNHLVGPPSRMVRRIHFEIEKNF